MPIQFAYYFVAHRLTTGRLQALTQQLQSDSKTCTLKQVFFYSQAVCHFATSSLGSLNSPDKQNLEAGLEALLRLSHQHQFCLTLCSAALKHRGLTLSDTFLQDLQLCSLAQFLHPLDDKSLLRTF